MLDSGEESDWPGSFALLEYQISVSWILGNVGVNKAEGKQSREVLHIDKFDGNDREEQNKTSKNAKWDTFHQNNWSSKLADRMKIACIFRYLPCCCCCFFRCTRNQSRLFSAHRNQSAKTTHYSLNQSQLHEILDRRNLEESMFEPDKSV